MTEKTVESQPFKVSLKVAIPFVLALLLVSYSLIERENKSIARITACEQGLDRQKEDMSILKARQEKDMSILKARAEANAEDIDDINIQYTRIQTQLVQINAGIIEVKEKLKERDKQKLQSF